MEDCVSGIDLQAGLCFQRCLNKIYPIINSKIAVEYHLRNFRGLLAPKSYNSNFRVLSSLKVIQSDCLGRQQLLVINGNVVNWNKLLRVSSASDHPHNVLLDGTSVRLRLRAL